ncbi:zf-U1-domain-containing protein [Microstroma glucosiphilum]|uniref:U1 small nuclear ribonucleoprotein C n=1 Tax=Pseudomicrostroma glucosiphilum TaxID=1684307 RepID=A0A316U1S6_9BASI|nr:zf-U1-domain-containing protein [Pseudomicrostroma glucosiphilum]PWN19319.1 zf-U1-domain-containing protein [Pseudomicrostroma glucosiphilum]
MGKHYCDYCDVYLTHDSVSVRKAHNSGRNHLQNVRDYYQSLDPAQVNAIVEEVDAIYQERGIEKPAIAAGPGGGFGGGGYGGGGGGYGGGFGGRGGFGGPRPPFNQGFRPPPPHLQQHQQNPGSGYGSGPPPGAYGQPPPNYRQPPPGAGGQFSRPPPPLGMRPPQGVGGYPMNVPPPGYNPHVPPPGFGGQQGAPGQGGPPPPLGIRQ